MLCWCNFLARSANHKQSHCWWYNPLSSSNMVLITGVTLGERPFALLGPVQTALSLVGPSGGRGRELCSISVGNFTPGRCAEGGTGGVPGVHGRSVSVTSVGRNFRWDSRSGGLGSSST